MPEKHALTFDATGPFHGFYSLTFKHPLKHGLKGRITGSYQNRLLGHLTINRFPGNVESSNDAFGSLGLEWHPFTSGHGSGRWFKGLYAVSEISLGHHTTVMQRWSSAFVDSTTVRGNWFAPTIRIGYEGLLLKRLIVAPEIGMTYRFNRIDYSGLGSGFFEPNGTVDLVSRKDLKSQNTGWEPVWGISVGHMF